MPRLFGTDGVRGLANSDLTVELALDLARAAAVVLGEGRMADGRRASGRRPVAVVARDPGSPASSSRLRCRPGWRAPAWT